MEFASGALFREGYVPFLEGAKTCTSYTNTNAITLTMHSHILVTRA